MSTTQTTRPDGRSSNSILRPFAAQVSCLSRADGSCKFSSGSTTILAAVFGPAAPRIASRGRNDQAIVAVVFKYASKMSSASSVSHYLPGYGSKEREIERFLGDALQGCVDTHHYPRTIIEVVLQVINADGSVVSAALNAAVLALMDAGVRMHRIPIGTTCLVKKIDSGLKSELIFDPTAEEESNREYSAIVLATTTTDKNHDDTTTKEDQVGVICSFTLGSFQLEAFLSCIEGSHRASKAVLAFMRVVEEQKVERESKTLWSSKV